MTEQRNQSQGPAEKKAEKKITSVEESDDHERWESLDDTKNTPKGSRGEQEARGQRAPGLWFVLPRVAVDSV